MNTYFRQLFILIFALTVSALRADVPSISVNILNPTNGVQVSEGFTPVSNIEYIKIQVAFDRKDNNQLKELTLTSVNPETSPLPSNYFTISVKDEVTNNEIPVKISIVRKTIPDNEGIAKMELKLEVLEDTGTRASKIQNYLNQLKTNQEAIPGTASEALVNRLINKNSQILAGIDIVYMENRLGKYKLSITYNSSQEGSWNGSVLSSDYKFEVFNKGSFFDNFSQP